MPDIRPRRWLLLALLVLATLGLAACDSPSAGPEEGADVEDVTDDEDAIADAPVTEEPPGEEAVDEGPVDLDPEIILGDPDQYVGQQVTVSGAVSEVLTDTAFTIGGGDTGGEALLIMSAEQADVTTDTEVQVTGTVREFNREELEADLGTVLDPAVFQPFDGAHVIVADAIEPLPPTMTPPPTG